MASQGFHGAWTQAHPDGGQGLKTMTRNASKVPEVTLGFWIVKIAATTLGETGGGTVTMTMDLGYLTGTAIFLLVLMVLVGLQIAAVKFHPFLYWTTIAASTTFGTTMADFADRSASAMDGRTRLHPEWLEKFS